MEQVYAFGVACTELVQDWFRDYDGYFELVNHYSNPHLLTETLLPLLSVIDSVFAAQFLLCMAFSGWLNTVLKWWFFEDRPYWWVRETSYYTEPRPTLLQTPQTCETGPGSPSGHSSAAAVFLTLCVMFTAHVAHDRKWTIPGVVKSIAYPLLAWLLGSVMLARVYAAAHFPHQCIIGAIVGLFQAPALCLYVSDPFIWRYGVHSSMPESRAMMWHCVCAILTAAIAGITFVAVAATKDPMESVHLAFRWCENPDSIRLTTTPVFALIQSTGYLLGWALAVSPAVAKYRHNTQGRSILISLFCTVLCMYAYTYVEDNLCKSNTYRYYVSRLVMFVVKPMIMLRLIPYLSMYPFMETKVKKN